MPKRRLAKREPTHRGNLWIAPTPSEHVTPEAVLSRSTLAWCERCADAIRFHRSRGMSDAALRAVYGATAVRYARGQTISTRAVLEEESVHG